MSITENHQVKDGSKLYTSLTTHRIHHTSWQSYNKYTQTNDYSFGTQSWFTQWNKIGLYYNNSLVWGIEPDCSQPIPTPTIGFAMFEKIKKVLNYLQ